MKTGVIIGKFYPPHAGHKYLIETALAQVDDLTVIVCAHPRQTVSGELRAEWLREIHPGLQVVTTPDDLPDEPLSWGRRTIEILGRAPDIVFTSEEYGHGYAAAMGCAHCLVDLDRITVPIRATAIRNDPVANWTFLEPCVRSYCTKRIVLVGVESTGKTTLAEQLAREFHAEWVPEYGREYCLTKTGEWHTDEFVHIAGEQQRREEIAARQSKGILICDTNAFATGVWHERYMGYRSSEVDAIGRKDRVDLYLLAMPDFPFVQDGTRDGENIRDWMQERFEARMRETTTPFIRLKGSRERRLSDALSAIRGLPSSPFGPA